MSTWRRAGRPQGPVFSALKRGLGALVDRLERARRGGRRHPARSTPVELVGARPRRAVPGRPGHRRRRGGRHRPRVRGGRVLEEGAPTRRRAARDRVRVGRDRHPRRTRLDRARSTAAASSCPAPTAGSSPRAPGLSSKWPDLARAALRPAARVGRPRRRRPGPAPRRPTRSSTACTASSSRPWASTDDPVDDARRPLARRLPAVRARALGIAWPGSRRALRDLPGCRRRRRLPGPRDRRLRRRQARPPETSPPSCEKMGHMVDVRPVASVTTATPARLDVRPRPTTAEEIGRVPVCTARPTSTGPSPPPRRPSPTEPLPPWRRAEILDAAARLLAERAEDFARTIAERGGQAAQDGAHRGRAGGRARSRSPRSRPASWRATMVPIEASRRRRGQAGLHAARADRRRRRHLAVQLPAQPGRPQGGARHRRRLPGRAQARQPDPAVGHRPGRAPARRVRAAVGLPATSSPAAGAKWATPSSSTPTSPTSPSPARPRSAGASRPRPRARRWRSSWATTRPVIIEPDGDWEKAARQDLGGRLQPRRPVVHLDPAGLRARRRRRRLLRRAGQAGRRPGRRRPAGRATPTCPR